MPVHTAARQSAWGSGVLTAARHRPTATDVLFNTLDICCAVSVQVSVTSLCSACCPSHLVQPYKPTPVMCEQQLLCGSQVKQGTDKEPLDSFLPQDFDPAISCADLQDGVQQLKTRVQLLTVCFAAGLTGTAYRKQPLHWVVCKSI